MRLDVGERAVELAVAAPRALHQLVEGVEHAGRRGARVGVEALLRRLVRGVGVVDDGRRDRRHLLRAVELAL